jgi:hypothetical protein
VFYHHYDPEGESSPRIGGGDVYRVFLKKHVQEHSNVFMSIMSQLVPVNEGDTYIDIFDRYTLGDRYGIWTIISFKHVRANLYRFGCCDLAPLSGFSRSDLYLWDGTTANHINCISYFRS